MTNALEAEKSWEILIELYKTGRKLTKGDLSKNIGGSSGTFKKRFDELEKEGLIGVEQEKEFPFKEWVYLTEKGRKVAKHLLEIKKIMESEE